LRKGETGEKNCMNFEEELQILRDDRFPWASGVFVRGVVRDFYFSAKLFELGTINPAFQNGGSRISKMTVIEISSGNIVYEWDRGLCLPAQGDEVNTLVEWLEGNLAFEVFRDRPDEAV
jgi:hypothetical protein